MNENLVPDKQQQYRDPLKIFSRNVSKTILALLGLGLLILMNWIFLKFKTDLLINQSLSDSFASTKRVEKYQNQENMYLKTRFPKIFWIYTQNQFDTQSMSEQIYLYYFNDTAKRFGYEVKLANSWTAYDYLSNITTARISKAMQMSKVDQQIHPILKMALLMENGGILINQFDFVFLGSNFNWVQDMFDIKEGKKSSYYGCNPSEAFLYMFENQDTVFGKRYSDPFIAAIPESLILKEAFQITLNFITTGVFPYDSELKIIEWNQDVGVHFISNILEQSINVVLYKQFSLTDSQRCTKYGMQSLVYRVDINYQSLKNEQKNRVLLSNNPEEQLKKITELKQIKLVKGLNSGPIIGILEKLIRNEVNFQKNMIPSYGQSSILSKILNAPVNKETFLITLPPRKVELCVIIIKDLYLSDMDKSLLQKFKTQSYNTWKQIMFVDNTNRFAHLANQKFIFLNSTFNLVRNIQIASTKYCGKQSYAILVHPDQNFNSPKAFQEIAEATSPRDVIGAFISLEKEGIFKNPKPHHLNFHRGRDAIVEPKIFLLQSIINHMRIFSVESFKYIPQFDLRDIHGQYFKDRLIFLMTLLEMVRTEVNEPRQLYVIKRYSSVWNVPRKAIIIKNQIALKTRSWEQVDKEQLIKTRSRLQCEEIKYNIVHTLLWKIPFSKMLAFNNGDEFIPVDKKKGPDLIPKVIHQVWIGTQELPPAKKYFVAKTRIMYPDFQVKLWRQQDITFQRFPLTYDLIQNLIAFNKKSPYSKLATVTDIIRHELLYHVGGFWKDAGMNILRPIFHKFLKYKIAIAVDKTFRYRWLQGMCFFANAPKIENMWRITNYRNLNRMKIYSNYASSIAGPIDFRQFIVGQEQYDPQILCLPYQTFYPAQVTQHPEKDKCTVKQEDIKKDDRYQIVQNGWYLLSNCSLQYPYSYALEHNRFGDSWVRRKET